MTVLYRFHVYQPFEFFGLELGFLELEGFGLRYFEPLEVRVGLEGLLLPYFCLEGFEPGSFELEELEPGRFEPEGLEFGGFGGFLRLLFLSGGGNSSGGR
jgi:hypothetical protein